MTCYMCSSDAPLYQTINLSVKPNPRGINLILKFDSNNPLLPYLLYIFPPIPANYLFFIFTMLKSKNGTKFSKNSAICSENSIKYIHYSIGSVIKVTTKVGLGQMSI